MTNRITRVVGIDPGLVHTGVVLMVFDQDNRQLTVRHLAVQGADTRAIEGWLNMHVPAGTKPAIYIEHYRRRSSFNTDDRMVQAVAKIHADVGGRVIRNTGVLKVVRRPLMELLGVWKFSTPTHHDDLRSAARVAVFGMLNDEDLNALVYEVVTSHLDGQAWSVVT